MVLALAMPAAAAAARKVNVEVGKAKARGVLEAATVDTVELKRLLVDALVDTLGVKRVWQTRVGCPLVGYTAARCTAGLALDVNGRDKAALEEAAMAVAKLAPTAAAAVAVTGPVEVEVVLQTVVPVAAAPALSVDTANAQLRRLKLRQALAILCRILVF